jgi:hypothetical protein
MYMFSREQVALHRPFTPGEDFHVSTACDIAYLACVSFRQGEGNVSRYGRDTKNVEFVRRGHRKQQVYCIILTWIAVNNYRPSCHK